MMNITATHQIQLRRLDRARPVRCGDTVVVDLGHAADVTVAQAWTIRSLVSGASAVQLRGSTASVREWLTSVLTSSPDVTP